MNFPSSFLRLFDWVFQRMTDIEKSFADIMMTVDQ